MEMWGSLLSTFLQSKGLMDILDYGFVRLGQAEHQVNEVVNQLAKTKGVDPLAQGDEMHLCSFVKGAGLA